MGRFLLFAVPFVIMIYALIDALMTPSNQARSLPKLLWLLLIVVVPLLGALAWLFLGRPRTDPYDRGGGWGGGGGGGGSDRPYSPRVPGLPGRRRGPVAPDDDPEFLQRLDQAAWERKMRRRRAAGSPEDDPHPEARA